MSQSLGPIYSKIIGKYQRLLPPLKYEWTLSQVALFPSGWWGRWDLEIELISNSKEKWRLNLMLGVSDYKAFLLSFLYSAHRLLSICVRFLYLEAFPFIFHDYIQINFMPLIITSVIAHFFYEVNTS